MLPKKKPNLDLNKNSTTYFFIGLVMVLLIVWRVIELKTYERDIKPDRLSVMDIEEENVPIVEIKMPLPPPPPPPAPPSIDIIPDDKEVIETFINPIEFDPNEVIPTEKIDFKDDEEDIKVTFISVEDIPIFPGCEKVSKKKQRKCFEEKIHKHVVKNFRYPEIAQEMGIQGSVYVSFIIDKEGNVVGVQPRGPDKNLEKEALRIIEKLPRMIPGKQRGKAVRVPYSIPITFRLQ